MAHLLVPPLAVYDHNINASNNYSTDIFESVPFLDVKRVHSDSGKFSYVVDASGKRHRVACLHFQGTAKKYMKRFNKTGRVSLLDNLEFVPRRIAGRVLRPIKRMLR